MKLSFGFILLVLWAQSSIAEKVKKEAHSLHFYSHGGQNEGGHEQGGHEQGGHEQGGGQGHGYDHGHGYSYGEGHYGHEYKEDNGLRNIAQGSAEQANSAVARQYSAAGHAAYYAKKSLAQKASLAAATALAALKAKEVILARLEEDYAESHKVLEHEVSQLSISKRASTSANQASQQAHRLIDVLSGALNSARQTAHEISSAASNAAAEYSSQNSMVLYARARFEKLKHKVEAAKSDYIATREAANKAAYSAAEAYKNANDNSKYEQGEHHGKEFYGGYGNYGSSFSYGQDHQKQHYFYDYGHTSH